MFDGQKVIAVGENKKRLLIQKELGNKVTSDKTPVLQTPVLQYGSLHKCKYHYTAYIALHQRR